MKHLVLVVALAAFSTSAFAKGSYQDENELRLVRAVLVVIEDGVKDGCLSNPNALKVEAELILRRSGISLSKSDPYYSLVIRPYGWEIKSEGGQPIGCVVVLDINLWRSTRVPEGHAALITAYRKNGLISGSKSWIQENLRTSVSEIVSDLANEILKARGN